MNNDDYDEENKIPFGEVDAALIKDGPGNLWVLDNNGRESLELMTDVINGAVESNLESIVFSTDSKEEVLKVIEDIKQILANNTIKRIGFCYPKNC